eukprot:41834-Chlamydomonas_euryale.AAC.1
MPGGIMPPPPNLVDLQKKRLRGMQHASCSRHVAAAFDDPRHCAQFAHAFCDAARHDMTSWHETIRTDRLVEPPSMTGQVLATPVPLTC